ncbi:MAG: hypothetical protein Q8Q94_03520 [bacterium]|nr:hypothetical protein [bacterium]MDZ4299576.1 hypothetical protein [Candidatus Sungbacteria bacterium]
MSLFLSMILFIFLINAIVLVFAGVFLGLQFLLPWLSWGVLVAVSGTLALPIMVVVLIMGMIFIQSKETFDKKAFFPDWEFKLKK